MASPSTKTRTAPSIRPVLDSFLQSSSQRQGLCFPMDGEMAMLIVASLIWSLQHHVLVTGNNFFKLRISAPLVFSLISSQRFCVLQDWADLWLWSVLEQCGHYRAAFQQADHLQSKSAHPVGYCPKTSQPRTSAIMSWCGSASETVREIRAAYSAL